MTSFRVVAINGHQFMVPCDELRDPNPGGGGGECPWFDSTTGMVCTIASEHPAEIMHIAHDSEGNVVAMFDMNHGRRLSDEEATLSGRLSTEQETA